MKSKQKNILLFPLFLVMYEFTVYLSNDMIMPGMVQVVREFSVSNAYIPQSLTVYLLGGCTLQIFLGPLSDRFGRRKLMLFGVFLFTICTFIAAFSQEINLFMLIRFFQGMGLCYINVIGYASIQEMYEEKKAISLISLMAIVSTTAPLLGPLMGGIYCEFFSWRGIFVITGSLGVISLLGLYLYMPEDGLYLKHSVEYKTITKVSSHFSIDISQIIKNYKNVFTNREFILGTFALYISLVPLLAWISVSPIVLIKKAGLSSFMYGIYQIPIFGSLIVGNLILQKFIERHEIRRIILVGAYIVFFGLLLCGILPIFFGESFLFLLIPMSIYSVGISISNAPLMRRVLFSTTVGKGTASAVLSVLGMLIMSVGTFSISYIYRSQSNLAYGLFCLNMGVLFIPLLIYFLKSHTKRA